MVSEHPLKTSILSSDPEATAAAMRLLPLVALSPALQCAGFRLGWCFITLEERAMLMPDSQTHASAALLLQLVAASQPTHVPASLLLVREVQAVQV